MPTAVDIYTAVRRFETAYASAMRPLAEQLSMAQPAVDILLFLANNPGRDTARDICTYRKLKPVYDRYKASKDKEKFLRGFESEIILFEAAAREIKKAGLAKLPSTEKLKAELDGLTTRKTALQAELRKIQREEKEYDMLHRNVDLLLSSHKNLEKNKEYML